MGSTAAYDEIADWYEETFLGGSARDPAHGEGDSLGIDRALRDLLGEGSGICLEIGCGTGVHAARVSQLGWIPVGVDLSAGMLQHARGRLRVTRADAGRLPFRDSSVRAAISVMADTDILSYPAVLREAARILCPGGVSVHVGVHPCFCGGFADRTDLNAIVIRPGYLDSHWTKASWTDKDVRDNVGVTHWPLPELIHAFLDADLSLARLPKAVNPLLPSWRSRPGSTHKGGPRIKSLIGDGPLEFISVRAAGQVTCAHSGEPGRTALNCNPGCNQAKPSRCSALTR